MNTLTSTAQNLFRRSKADDNNLLLPPLAPEIKKTVAITVDIVIPVYNEAPTLERQIKKLKTYLDQHLTYDWTVVIADNGSQDETWILAQKLQAELSRIRAVHFDKPGRGRALKQVWQQSRADIMAYMDVDLSTDLSAIAPLLEPLAKGEALIATGSRLRRQSSVARSFKREFISRSYNRLLRWFLGLKTSDAQCGFKAITALAAREVLPEVSDEAWFFDTELLVRAERHGLTVHEVAVAWQEDPDSRVNIIKTAHDDVRGIRRLRREFAGRPRREAVAIGIILAVTALLYGIGAAHNGYGNSFYAAAVQAGTHSWKAFFFGSLDASNYITVDKPPFALWMMEISTRIFGFHSWSMLLPDVLTGLGTVYLVYATVRRWFGGASGLIAAAITALTPVAVLMFGFNNPDAVLTCLLTLSVYAVVRALDSSRPVRWLALAAVATGCAFNTKMLQGLVLVPVLGAVYLLAAKPRFWVRVKHLVVTLIVLAMAALWWPLIVSATPASSRPYIGSSTNNSIWNLILGYNGVGRLLGDSTGQGGSGSRRSGTADGNFAPPSGAQTGTTSSTAQSMTPPTTGTTSRQSFGGGMPGAGAGGGFGGGRSGFGGSTGVLRMFNSDFGPNIAWFIPAGFLMTGFALWRRRRAPRIDAQRTGFLLWGGYLLLHVVVFSMVSGVIHPYYPVVMAPAIGALIGMGVPLLYRAYRRGGNGAMLLPVVVAATGVTATILLGDQTTFLPALRWFILALSLLTALALIARLYLSKPILTKSLLTLAAVTCLAAPTTYALDTATVAHTGSIPSAGPSGTGMAGSNNESASAETALVQYLLAHQGNAKWIVAVASANQSAAIQISTGQPVMAVGGFNGSDDALSVTQLQALIRSGQLRYYAVSGTGTGGGFGMGNNTIQTWIEAHGTKVNYGGTGYTLYDLSASAS